MPDHMHRPIPALVPIQRSCKELRERRNADGPAVLYIQRPPENNLRLFERCPHSSPDDTTSINLRKSSGVPTVEVKHRRVPIGH